MLIFKQRRPRPVGDDVLTKAHAIRSAASAIAGARELRAPARGWVAKLWRRECEVAVGGRPTAKKFLDDPMAQEIERGKEMRML
jgi:hypothetical protein